MIAVLVTGCKGGPQQLWSRLKRPFTVDGEKVADQRSNGRSLKSLFGGVAASPAESDSDRPSSSEDDGPFRSAGFHNSTDQRADPRRSPKDDPFLDRQQNRTSQQTAYRKPAGRVVISDRNTNRNKRSRVQQSTNRSRGRNGAGDIGNPFKAFQRKSRNAAGTNAREQAGAGSSRAVSTASTSERASKSDDRDDRNVPTVPNLDENPNRFVQGFDRQMNRLRRDVASQNKTGGHRHRPMPQSRRDALARKRPQPEDSGRANTEHTSDNPFAKYMSDRREKDASRSHETTRRPVRRTAVQPVKRTAAPRTERPRREGLARRRSERNEKPSSSSARHSARNRSGVSMTRGTGEGIVSEGDRSMIVDSHRLPTSESRASNVPLTKPNEHNGRNENAPVRDDGDSEPHPSQTETDGGKNIDIKIIPRHRPRNSLPIMRQQRPSDESPVTDRRRTNGANVVHVSATEKQSKGSTSEADDNRGGTSFGNPSTSTSSAGTDGSDDDGNTNGDSVTSLPGASTKVSNTTADDGKPQAPPLPPAELPVPVSKRSIQNANADDSPTSETTASASASSAEEKPEETTATGTLFAVDTLLPSAVLVMVVIAAVLAWRRRRGMRTRRFGA